MIEKVIIVGLVILLYVVTIKLDKNEEIRKHNHYNNHDGK